MSRLEDGVYFVDRDRNILFWNRAAERLTGYASRDVLGRSCSDNILRHVTDAGRQLCVEGCPLAATMSDNQVLGTEVYMHHANGHRVPIAVWAAPLQDRTGAVVGAIEIFSDHSDRSAVRAELEFLRNEVLTDPLTGMGNRRFLEITVEPRLAAVRKGAPGFGLFMVDIDHFKDVNDLRGHLVGDKVLAMVARTLGSAVRPLDAGIRWGGEEFILVCPNVPAETLQSIAERLRILVENSWVDLEDGSRLSVTVSVGASRARSDDDLTSIISRADARLYKCKRSGRNMSIAGE
jgi:diguanylate cyclase (GGDEF)-like protein/PAS domain S-box-containing protein